MNGQVLSTSSIGASWPPAVSSYERIRGFYPNIIRNLNDTKSFLEDIQFSYELYMTNSNIGRVTLRAIFDSDSLQVIPNMDTLLETEAAMPLLMPNGEQLHLVYFGDNKEGRKVDDSVIKIHEQTVETAMAKPHYFGDPLTDLARYGIGVGHLTNNEAEELFDSFCNLYSAFGYDSNDTRELIENEDNHIVYAQDLSNGAVISTVLAESAIIDIIDHDHSKIKICEFTEAITHPEMRGKGLYKRLSTFLLEILKKQETNKPNIIYGESNLASIGVINSAHQTGRLFSMNDPRYENLRKSGFGVLKQNFSVKDGYESRPYNDFAVTYYDLQPN